MGNLIAEMHRGGQLVVGPKVVSSKCGHLGEEAEAEAEGEGEIAA
jgi:hypothetical protein